VHQFEKSQVLSCPVLRSGFGFVGLVAAPVVAAFLLFGFAAPAHANLLITPTFDSSITSDPNAAAIEAGINAAISRVEGDILNPVTVNITFQEGSGLGGSSTFIGSLAYSTYVNALKNNQILSANDNTAIASLPASPSAVNGNANANVVMSLPLLRALGFSVNPPPGNPDSTITLNTSIMNLSRTGPQNSGFYDIQAVAGHEMDEVLGAGGAGSEIAQSGNNIGPLDLFRYTAAGVRSFTVSTTAAPYFSIDGGTTDLVHFNQAGGGSDYADWGDGVSPADGSGNSPPQIQDAFGTPGVDVNIGTNELTSLDVIGWNLVPEPASTSLLAVGAMGCLVRRRRAAN
jgi:hypothetical protein